MQKHLTFKQKILVAGTLFGMFFGAGNLIFPVHLGQLAGRNVLPAMIGFIITAVGIPIMGVAAIGNTHSDGLQQLSKKVGNGYSYFFSCLLYLTIGPGFAIPRCATTSFTVGVAPMLGAGASESIALLIFSVIFFAIVLILSLRPGEITVWIGKVITPIFLVFLAILVVTALINPSTSVSDVEPAAGYQTGALSLGFIEGYNTMDTLAAIVFGIVIALNVQACGVSEKKAVARSIMKAGVIAGVFLFTVYGLLAWLGARGSAVLAQAADGTAVLSGLCLQFFGPVGALLLAAIFFVACFNVCTGLLSSCAAFFHEKFPRFSFIRWLQAFTVVSFLVSILGLELILKISVPILTLLYPVAIAIIVINLLPFAWAQKPVVHRVVTVLAFAVSIWSMF